jgi:hypothetical protein
LSIQFGTLSKIENIRDYWKHEARDFTNWLATPENLQRLADAIGCGALNLMATEAEAGDFRIDIVAQASDRDETVIIENQLERTDHDHFGKIMTYAAARDARTIVWIAKDFRDEHKLALEWLNRQNQAKAVPVAYFGIEIELWRIDQSAPAPRFNVVVQPNEYAKRVAEASEAAELSDTKRLQFDFWAAFRAFCESSAVPYSLPKPAPQHWYTLRVGRSGFDVGLTVNTRLKRIGCELYISGEKPKESFDRLLEQRSSIEASLGTSEIEWQRLDHGHASRIVEYHDGDIADRNSWHALFAWMKDRVEAYRSVFGPLVIRL